MKDKNNFENTHYINIVYNTIYAHNTRYVNIRLRSTPVTVKNTHKTATIRKWEGNK